MVKTHKCGFSHCANPSSRWAKKPGCQRMPVCLAHTWLARFLGYAVARQKKNAKSY